MQYVNGGVNADRTGFKEGVNVIKRIVRLYSLSNRNSINEERGKYDTNDAVDIDDGDCKGYPDYENCVN